MNTESNPYTSPASSGVGNGNEEEMQEGTRPNSPFVIGSLSIVFGGIGLLMTAGSLFFQAATSTTIATSPALGSPEMMPASILYGAGYVLTLTLFGFIDSATLIVAGTGLSRYRRWGRVLFQIYATVTILLNVGNAAYIILFVVPKVSAGDAFLMSSTFGVAGIVGGAISGCLFPVIGLIFLFRPRITSWLC